MTFRTVVVGLVAGFALTGCMQTDAGFGGSGGSGGSGGGSGTFTLAQDTCKRALRDQGMVLVSIDSTREYPVTGAARGVEVGMTVRHDSMTVTTEQRVCRFRYADATADISRT
jgi:hypothetical protein